MHRFEMVLAKSRALPALENQGSLAVSRSPPWESLLRQSVATGGHNALRQISVAVAGPGLSSPLPIFGDSGPVASHRVHWLQL